jgi:YHS domain-containing protein
MEKQSEKKPCECKNCCKQIPTSAALTAEGKDYVWHFCSKNCYEKWHADHKKFP